MNHGYVKLQRTDATRELFKDPNAFVLLAVIATRAKRTVGFSVLGLKTGQALIGDYEAYGLTQKAYRRAKVRLERYGLVAFKGTGRGTIATLLNNAVYDINDEGQPGRTEGEPRANRGRTKGDRGATNNNEKNEKKGKGPPLSCSSSYKTFAEMDRERAQAALAQAEKEFLADEEE